ncbi:NAD-dependent epimerase [Stratiformator vulcanicus]|uniref:UDP-glucose 4-epimerase n=1 Tax=Stratiformator vulcanicus TaxID=2527980 RepID=A0A517R595_9PLAN|nr:NAD-dependent epimerase [Stratiformator vulcanicus]QDT39067.1 UDP-glucose 4-epimerase [Stratiformator vulcanicus]
MAKILVTGAAGFIGYHVAGRLLDRADSSDPVEVVGLDNLSPYYDVTLKEARLQRLRQHDGFRFVRAAVEDRDVIANLFREERFDRVIHLAAQAGVRYSLTDPEAYVDSNLVGFLNILEGCRHGNVGHLVYASSSSVYGANRTIPFRERGPADHPVSLYAATKRANELMAHSYSHLFQLPTTGLRFFTVYGPWGRPDMALFKFTKAILAGEPIEVFNEGRMRRDFTYIDDIAEGVVRTCDAIPDGRETFDENDPATGTGPFRLFNIGNNEPIELMRLIEVLEGYLGRTATKTMLPMQPGDVEQTFACVDDLGSAVGFSPKTPIETGVQSFVEWYRAYYNA